MAPESPQDFSTVLCGECIARRGLTLPADPVWLIEYCHTCQTPTLCATPLQFAHHTRGEPPLDCGGNDGIA